MSSLAGARSSSGNNYTGVAPEAKLRVYRVFSCDKELVEDDVLIKAMTAAYLDQVDTMNLSIGGSSGFSDGPTSAVASRIVAKGTGVVISAGNSGDTGAYFADSPAAGINVTSVGSIENADLATYSIYAQGTSDGEKELRLLSFVPFQVPQGKLLVKPVSPGIDPASDGCDASAVAAAGPYDNTVVLIARGGCNADVKYKNILNNGGKYVLLHSKALPYGIRYTRSTREGQQVGVLSHDDAVYLRKQVASGNAVQIDFSRQIFAIVPNQVNGGRMSEFASMSPDWDNRGAVAMSAPGGNILGAWPLGEFPANARPLRQLTSSPLQVWIKPDGLPCRGPACRGQSCVEEEQW